MNLERVFDSESELTNEDLATIALAEKQLERGEVIDFEEVFRKIKNKYSDTQI